MITTHNGADGLYQVSLRFMFHRSRNPRQPEHHGMEMCGWLFAGVHVLHPFPHVARARCATAKQRGLLGFLVFPWCSLRARGLGVVHVLQPCKRQKDGNRKMLRYAKSLQNLRRLKG